MFSCYCSIHLFSCRYQSSTPLTNLLWSDFKCRPAASLCTKAWCLRPLFRIGISIFRLGWWLNSALLLIENRLETGFSLCGIGVCSSRLCPDFGLLGNYSRRLDILFGHFDLFVFGFLRLSSFHPDHLRKFDWKCWFYLFQRFFGICFSRIFDLMELFLSANVFTIVEFIAFAVLQS